MAHVKQKEDGTVYLSDDWYIQDVESVCDRMEVTLTHDEMVDVLRIVADSADANYGISWDSFEYAIEDILTDRENENANV